MFCAAFEGLLRGDKAGWQSFLVAKEFSFSKIRTVHPSQGLRPGLDSPDQGKENSLKTKKKLRALITEGANAQM